MIELRDQMHSADRADNQNSLDVTVQLKHSIGVPKISERDRVAFSKYIW